METMIKKAELSCRLSLVVWVAVVIRWTGLVRWSSDASCDRTYKMLSIRGRSLGYFRGYWITPSALWFRQRGRWVELRRDDIAAVKFKAVGRIIVRFYGGQRIIVSLYGFSNPGHNAVCRALRDALHQNDRARGLWHGARILEVYG